MKINHLSILVFGIVLFAGATSFAQHKPEAVALTPPMGWNSWNCFRTGISEEKIKSVVDAMISSGMKDAGYEYIIIDDGWMTNDRDDKGHIVVDSVKFPNGIKPLADYIHNLGLKFGIYSAPGCFTCSGFAGSLGHEQIDADDYASWGVDFLKYDWCTYPKTKVEAKKTTEADCRAAFELMRDCLYNTGRPIIYSVHDKCTNMSEEENALPWVKKIAHLHRTSNDIKNNWDRMLYCLESTADLWEYAESGYWNDPDMLEVGNTTKEKLWGGISEVKMNLTEFRAHFSMWCMVAAPLIAGNDIRSMSPDIAEILINKEIIAINQDSLGKQGRRIRDDGEQEIWIKELSGKRWAIALFNRSSKPANIKVNWHEIQLEGKLKVRNLWEHKDIGQFDDYYVVENIPAHDAIILLVEKSSDL